MQMPFRPVMRWSAGLVVGVLLVGFVWVALQHPEFALRENAVRLIFWGACLLVGMPLAVGLGTLVDRALARMPASGQAGSWVLLSACSLGVVRLLWSNHAQSVISLALAVAMTLVAVLSASAAWTVICGQLRSRATAVHRGATFTGWCLTGAVLIWGMLWLIQSVLLSPG